MLNGKNLTRSREDMWLVPYMQHVPPERITVTFAEPILASGMFTEFVQLVVGYQNALSKERERESNLVFAF